MAYIEKQPAVRRQEEQPSVVVEMMLPEYRERYPRAYAGTMRLMGPLMKKYAVTKVRVRLRGGQPVHVHTFMTDLLD